MSVPARTVVFDGLPAALRGNVVTPPVPSWLAKGPDDTVICYADFSYLIGDALVAGVSVNVENVRFVTGYTRLAVVAVVLADGTAGVDGVVAITATTSYGEVIRAVATIPIVSAVPELQGSVPVADKTSGVITLDAAPAVIAALAIGFGGGSVLRATGTVVARNVATGAPIAWDVSALVWMVGTATPLLQGDPSVTVYQADPSMAGCGLTVAAGPSGLVLTGTGLAGTPITWSTTFDSAAA